MVFKVFCSKAVARYIRISPFKVRRIIDLIRGRSFEESLMILVFMQYGCSRAIFKVLKSASKNAQQNFGISKSTLFVKDIRVQAGPIMKRFRPRAQGRGFPIKKPTCHIFVTLSNHFIGNLLFGCILQCILKNFIFI
jgi:large subunit ribosomal protein L22